MAVWLDDLFDEHPKVQLLPDERAAWLYVRGLLYCQRNPKTRGRIPKLSVPELTKLARPAALAAMLAADHGAGVLWEDDGAFWKVHDWELYNQRAIERGEELDEQQHARRERAAKAANTRWAGRKAASPEHAPSINGASPEHAPSMRSASVEQCSDDASRVRGRAPDPVPIPASPSLLEAPVGMLDACSEHAPDDARGDARPMLDQGAEMETQEGKTQVNGHVDPELARWLGMWPARRQAHARRVWDALSAHLSSSFLGAVVGHCVERKPSSPNYLTHTALSWARDQGVLPPGHPAYDLLSQEAR